MPDKLKGHHILLYAGDFARLQNIYHSVSPNYVIRESVRKHIENAEQTLQEMYNPNLKITRLRQEIAARQVLLTTLKRSIK